MPLSPEHRTKLDDLVQRMTSANEPEENIRAVVDDFKKKYESASIAPAMATTHAPKFTIPSLPEPPTRSATEFLADVGSDVRNLAGGLAQTVTSPIETTKLLGKAATGAGMKLLGGMSGDPMTALPPVPMQTPRGEISKSSPPELPPTETKRIGEAVTSEIARNWSDPATYLRRHPVSALSDLSILAAPVAVGAASRLPRVARAAEIASTVLDPAAATIAAGSALKSTAPVQRALTIAKEPLYSFAASRRGTGKFLDPVRHYARALKPQASSPEELAEKARIGMTGVEGNPYIPGSTEAVEQAREVIRKSGEEVDKIIATNPNAPAYMNEVLAPLEGVKARFSQRPYAEVPETGDLAKIEKVRELALSRSGVRPSRPEEMRFQKFRWEDGKQVPVETPTEIPVELARRPPEARTSYSIEEIPAPPIGGYVPQAKRLPEQMEMPTISPHEGSPGGGITSPVPATSFSKRLERAGAPSLADYERRVASAPSPEIPPDLPQPVPIAPTGLLARSRAESAFGPAAETIPERLFGTSPGEELARKQLGTDLAATIPSGTLRIPPPPPSRAPQQILPSSDIPSPHVPPDLPESPMIRAEQGTLWRPDEANLGPSTVPTIRQQREIIPELPQGQLARPMQGTLETPRGSTPSPDAARALRDLELAQAEAPRIRQELAEMERRVSAGEVFDEQDQIKYQNLQQQSADIPRVQQEVERLKRELGTLGTEPVLPVSLTQSRKQGIYAELGDRAYGEQMGPEVEALKAVAHGSKMEVDRIFPEAVPFNQASGEAQMILPDLMRAAVRAGTGDQAWIPLFGSLRTEGLLVMRNFLRQPQTRAKFALWLDRKPIPSDPGQLRQAIAAIPKEKLALVGAKIDDYLNRAMAQSTRANEGPAGFRPSLMPLAPPPLPREPLRP